VRSYLGKKQTKKSQERAGGVVQGTGPEFKCQHRKKKKKKKEWGMACASQPLSQTIPRQTQFK
jgi:hypothetical protein